MSGKKHFAVISSQMDRSEKHIEKTNGKDVPVLKKVEESSEPQSLQVPLDGDIPIFTEEFLNYNKGNYVMTCYINLNWKRLQNFPSSDYFFWL